MSNGPYRTTSIRVSLGELLTFKAAAARNRMSLGELMRTATREAALECLETEEAAPAAEAPTRGRKPGRPPGRRR